MLRNMILITGLVWHLSYVADVLALTVTPMSVVVEPAERVALRVTNDGARTVTVEMTVVERNIDETDNQTLEPRDGDFLIFPPLAAIPAGATQAVQVQYVGDPSLARSRSFYVRVGQLPVDVEPVRVEGGGEITFLIAFAVVVHVVPPGSVPEIRAAEVAPATLEGGSAVAVTFENVGSRFVYLRDATLTFKAGAKSADLTQRGNDILADQNVLQPGKRRRVVLPLPEGMRPQGVEVEVALRETYR